MKPWILWDNLFSWTVVSLTRKLEFEDVVGGWDDKFQWVITICFSDNFGIEHRLVKTPLRRGIYLMHQIWCFYKRILAMLTTVTEKVDHQWYPTWPTKLQLTHYFHLKQTFLLKMIIKTQKKKIKRKKERKKWSHAIQQSDS